MKVERRAWILGVGMALLSFFAMGQACPAGQDALEKWQRLPPERQLELKQRFEDFRSLDPESRRLLLERAERLRGQLERLPERATQAETERWLSLPAELRRQTLGDYLRAQAHFHLPGTADHAASQVRSEPQGPVGGSGLLELERARAEVRAKIGERALERLGSKLGLTSERIKELQALPPNERAAALQQHLERRPDLNLPPQVQHFLERRQYQSPTAPGPQGHRIPGRPTPSDRRSPGATVEGERPGFGRQDPAPSEGTPDSRRDFGAPGQRPPPFPPVIARRLLDVCEPRLADFLDAAEGGRRLSPREFEVLQRQRLFAEFPRIAELPQPMQAELQEAPMRELLARARAGLDQPRRQWGWPGDRGSRPQR